MACGIVIPFVQAQVLSAWRACHYYTLQGRSQEFRIMDVGSSHRYAQGSAYCVDQDASSCSRLCAGRWGCVQWRPPKRALPIEQSADCHSQFTPPNSWHSSIRTAQMASSAPHSTQRWC